MVTEKSIEKDQVVKQIEKSIFVSPDVGNNATKVIAEMEGKQIQFIMPTGFVFKTNVAKSKIGLTNELNEINNDYFEIDERKTNPTVYEWYENVNENRYYKPLKGGSDRYESLAYRIFISMVLSKVAEKFEVLGDFNVNFYVRTGVPSYQIDTPLRESVEDAFLNAPTISAKGIKFTPNVKMVDIVSQPVGTIIDFLVNDKLIPKNEKIFSNHRIVVTDIGGGTVDSEEIENTESVEESRSSLEHGMNRVHSQIAKELKKMSGRNIHSSEVAVQFDNDYFYFNQNNEDDFLFMKEVKEKAIQEMFEMMVLEIETNFENLRIVDFFILTGGGAVVFAPLFEEYFKSRKIKFIVVEDSQFSNVRGFFKLLMMKKIKLNIK